MPCFLAFASRRPARVPTMLFTFFLVGAIAAGPRTKPGRASAPPTPTSGAPPGGLQSYPALASCGSTLFAAWTDGREGSLDRLFWTHFPGDPPDSIAAPLTIDAASELHPALAADSGWALAVWESWTAGETRLCAAALDASRAPAPRDVTRVTAGRGPVRRPTVAVHGESGVLVWEDERVKPGDLYFARWDRTGGLLDPDGISFATGAGFRSWARAAASAHGFLVVWTESTEEGVHRVRLRAVGKDGIPADSARGISGDLDMPTESDAVAVGSRWLVVWRERGNGGSDLVGRFADSTGVPLGSEAFSVSASAGFEYGPRLAAAGEGACLIWFDQDAAGRRLRRAWVDATGAVHPAGGIALTDPADYVADAALAVRGAEAVAAWRLPLPLDDDDLYAGVYPAQDTVIVPAPVPLVLAGAVTGLEPEGRGSPPALMASPNPFRRGVCLSAQTAYGSGALVIMDVSGRRVRSLENSSGAKVLFWDGRTDRGKPAPPGVYLARISGNPHGVRLVKLP